MPYHNDRIISFENGELRPRQVVQLFQELINSGAVWKMPHFYRKAARELLYAGYCTTPENNHDAV